MKESPALDRKLIPLDIKKPAHKHKCKSCMWLATFAHPGPFSKAAPCDVYFCDKDDATRIVIRYGSGTNVSLHNTWAETQVPEFNEGMRLAREKGMLP